MKITIAGAAGGEVTGSAYVVQTCKACILVDAGLFQGSKESEAKNRLPQGVELDKLDAVLLTHAHLDHTGRVPLLLKNGYHGPIFATPATIDLAEIILEDAAKIQFQDAVRKSRKSHETVDPLYGPEDMAGYRDRTREVNLHEPVVVADGMTARYYEAGHMFGSSSIELTVEEESKKKVIVFSGDLGPLSSPILKPFDQLSHADIVVMESTYGDRDHRPYAETVQEFEEIVKDVVEKEGKMLIPTFAVGRAQQILYQLAVLFMQKRVKPFPVYVDSPMAIEAGLIFPHYPDLFDEEMLAWKAKGMLPLDRTYFKLLGSVEESKQLNGAKGPCAILAGSGMCNGGRIQHHLKFNLPSPNTHVLIVGYQGEGSLGRQLVDGQQEVRIFGEIVDVRAKIHTLSGFSAHAGQSDLLTWFSSLADAKPRVVLTHGENRQREALAQQIENRFQLFSVLPNLGDVIEV